jgi:outer membrane protein assembly factor BamB
VDADVKKVDRLRRQLDVAGLYGKRVTLLTAEPDSFGAPPFIANLVVADGAFAARLGDATVARKVYESVRPYGGALWIAGTGLAEKIKSAALPNAAIKEAGGATLVLREGMLPGSADWTHQYGSIANTVKSDDRTVKLPLGLLWFGGNTHMDVLPRHGHGPSEQVAGGRLVIEGMDCISARDVYTGRLMWKTVIPGLDNFGVYYDATFTNNSLTTLYNQKHIPGANARGANYVLTDDKVYVAISNHCVVLDAASGKIISQIQMPVREGQPTAAEWAYIGVYEDVLLGGAGFAHYNKKFGLRSVTWPPPVTDLAASAGLVAFNRHTGDVLWRVEATNSFIHNGIVAGKGRVYCLDRLPKSGEDKARRGGHKAGEGYRVIALELRTGKPIWEHTQHVFGTWLGYSTEFDVLLQAGASATDRLKDEASTGMLVFKGTDGSVLWHKPDLKYTGPCILYKDFIITTPTYARPWGRPVGTPVERTAGWSTASWECPVALPQRRPRDRRRCTC